MEAGATPPRRPARRLRIVCAALVVAALLGAFLIAKGYVEQARRADGVRTVKVTRGSLEVTAAATGTFQPLEYVDVGAQLSGQLKAVKVQPGDVVRRGQVIAEIDDATAKARLTQTEASLASVSAQIAAKRAQTDLARVQRDRITPLVKAGAVSAAEHDIAKTALESLAAETASLQSQAAGLGAVIDQARTELRFAVVRAPMDGVVVALVARPGQTLNAAQQAPVILRIANLQSLALIAQVSEADVVNLVRGMEARFNLLGVAERSFAGRVRQILPSPNVINSVVFYDAVVEVVRPEELFRIGMTAQVFFVLARHDCMLKIPRIALPADFKAPRVLPIEVLGANRKPRKVMVEIAAANDLEGGVPCKSAGAAGLGDGDEIVMPAIATRDKKR